MGVPLTEVAKRIARLAPAKRRGEVRHLRQGVTVVDDSYNSSPSALKTSLAMLASEPVAGRRVAVLGEMLELGALAMTLHEACGRSAAAAGLGLRSAVEAGLDSQVVRHLATSTEAADLVAMLVGEGDVVLVKGSRGVKTDLVVDRLVAMLG